MKILSGIGLAIVLVVVSTLVWFFLLRSSEEVPALQPNSPTTLPVGGTVQVPDNQSSSNTTPGSMTVLTLSGATIKTNDFVHNGVTIPDEANKGRYLLSGDLGYCVSESESCRAGDERSYNIYFNSTHNSFTIALLEEPLGEVRTAAEQFLLKTLGISTADMCKLNYYVGTTFEVNAAYASKNLGFSFCSGATVLPK
ncbi:MAG: hypothetical protein JWN18_656 [Parcubacteria group bacterium]|nr:hypothetical protein [Parcubacteria group bacterium]